MNNLINAWTNIVDVHRNCTRLDELYSRRPHDMLHSRSRSAGALSEAGLSDSLRLDSFAPVASPPSFFVRARFFPILRWTDEKKTHRILLSLSFRSLFVFRPDGNMVSR